MKHLLLVAILAGVPACLPPFYLPASPPQMTTIRLPEAPEAAYRHTRQAVAATRMAYARVPGAVVLYITVLPDQDGADVLVIGRAQSDRPVDDARLALRQYATVLHQEATRE